MSYRSRSLPIDVHYYLLQNPRHCRRAAHG